MQKPPLRGEMLPYGALQSTTVPLMVNIRPPVLPQVNPVSGLVVWKQRACVPKAVA